MTKTHLSIFRKNQLFSEIFLGLNYLSYDSNKKIKYLKYFCMATVTILLILLWVHTKNREIMTIKSHAGPIVQ